MLIVRPHPDQCPIRGTLAPEYPGDLNFPRSFDLCAGPAAPEGPRNTTNTQESRTELDASRGFGRTQARASPTAQAGWTDPSQSAHSRRLLLSKAS